MLSYLNSFKDSYAYGIKLKLHLPMIQSIESTQSIPPNTSSTQDTLSPLISLVPLQPFLKTYNTDAFAKSSPTSGTASSLKTVL